MVVCWAPEDLSVHVHRLVFIFQETYDHHPVVICLFTKECDKDDFYHPIKCAICCAVSLGRRESSDVLSGDSTTHSVIIIIILLCM